MCPVTAGRPRPDHSRSVQTPISLSLPLITYMPVGHLFAAPTDLLTVSFQQLSGFVSVSLKASTAAGKLTLIGGSCVLSCLNATCHYVGKKSPPDWTVLPCLLVPNP